MSEQSKKYEIVNPSDKCFLTAPTLLVAALAVALLGDGKYGLKDHETGETAVPLFIFGGHDEWFQSQFGSTFEQLLDTFTHPDAAMLLAAALQSVEYAGERGSLNNIKARADQLAMIIKDTASARAEEADRADHE